MHRKSLISQPNIQRALLRHLIRTCEAPHTKPIIDRHSNDRFPNSHRLVHNEREIIALVSAAAIQVSAAMDPKSDGEVLVLVASRTDDIEVETVF
jgi:hypothetical protein